MGKIWQLYGLSPDPGDAGDKVLELQFRHLRKNIPWLYLVMIFNICSCIYAVTDSSSVVLRIVIPIMVISIAFTRLFLYLRSRNEKFVAKKALKLVRSMAIASGIIGILCASWSVMAWQWETSSFRFYIPAFMALGAFSVAYCLSLTPRVAILNVCIGIIPICTLLFTSGIMIDAALAGTMVACTLFLIALIRRQHRNMIRTINLQIEMHMMAHTDSLTGLNNRRAFHEQLDQILAERKTGNCISLAMIDLDGFKQINDCHGHLAGDRVLQIAADRLMDSVGDYASVSRLGGDEFAVLFEGKPPTFCRELVKAAIQKIEMPVDVDGEQLSVGASYGLTSINGEDDVRAVVLISQTDLDMYEMKKRRTDKGAGPVTNERAA